jgi:SNF2 family DNA or RNA helicase
MDTKVPDLVSQSGQAPIVTHDMPPLRPLFKHQKEALNWLYARSTPNMGGAALFMEMRLGKTKVVIEALKEYGRILVVAPLTVLTAWKTELEIEHQKYWHLHGTQHQRYVRFGLTEREKGWFLINYEGLLSCDKLVFQNWDAVVLDESTRIKNPQSKITRLLTHKNAFPCAKAKVILSGKPAPESPLDYFEQFKFIYGQFMKFNNFWHFRDTCFFQIPNQFEWLPKPQWKHTIKDYVQANSFILSRKQAGIGNKKFYEVRTVPLEPKQKKLMEKVEKDFVLETPEGEMATKWVPVQYVWLAQIAGGFVDHQLTFKKKYDELINLLNGELKDEKVVIWFRFNEELKQALAMVKKIKGKSVSSITGETPFNERASRINSFRHGELQVLLLQERIGLFGLDLSSASTAIYFSNGFSLETRSQTEDRIENPNKNEPLLIIDLVTENSMDEYILKALKRKNRDSNYFMSKDIYEQIKQKYSQH